MNSLLLFSFLTDAERQIESSFLELSLRKLGLENKKEGDVIANEKDGGSTVDTTSTQAVKPTK